MKERWAWVSKGPKGDGAIRWHLRLAGHQPAGPCGPLAAGHGRCGSHSGAEGETLAVSARLTDSSALTPAPLRAGCRGEGR